MPRRQITQEIRADVLSRTSMTSSREEISRVIYDALVKANVDWKSVPRWEIKDVLLEALRAFKRRTLCVTDPASVPGYAAIAIPH